jgi:serine/threonine-protein kinase
VIARAVTPSPALGGEDSAIPDVSPPEPVVPPRLARPAWIVAAVIAILLALGLVSYGALRHADQGTGSGAPVAPPKSGSSGSAGSRAPTTPAPAGTKASDTLKAANVKSAALASFEVESSPPGLVRVNGKLVGSSPVRLKNQLPGSVQIEVYNTAKAFSRQQTFELSPGDNGTKRLVIEQGTIEFRVRPYATVLLDGKRLGETPFPAVRAYEGHHSVRLVNRNINKNVTVDFVVKAGQPNIFKYNLND